MLVHNIVLACLVTVEATELVKTFRFGANRKKNELWTNSSQVWDWDKANCVRLDQDPIPLPPKYTWCNWFRKEINAAIFVFYSLASTNDGQSIMEHAKRNNETPFKDWFYYYGANASVTNLLVYDTYYETLESVWGGYWDNMARFKDFEYQKWYATCEARDTEAGKMTVYVNGELMDEKIMEDNRRESFQQRVNFTSDPTNPPVTDVFIGCYPWGGTWYYNSFGSLTQVDWFDRILTHNEMVAMTTCDGKKQKGNLINWETANWTVLDNYYNVQPLTTTMESICPKNNFGGLPIYQHGVKLDKMAKMCKKLKRKVLTILDENTYKMALIWLAEQAYTYVAYYAHYYFLYGYFVAPNGKITTACQDPDKDLNFTDLYTDQDCPSDVNIWNVGQPFVTPVSSSFSAENSHLWYSKGDPENDNEDPGGPQDIYHNESLLMSRGLSYAHCVGDSHQASRLEVVIKGLCNETKIETDYIWYGWTWKNWYIAKGNTTIEYSTDWTIKKDGATDVIIYASGDSLALGRHKVLVEDDPCTKGKTDKNLMITLTHCDDDEYTCDDGNCISMAVRCNRISDCPDASDESNCMILITGDGYIADYEPVTVDDNYDIVKVPVHVDIDVLNILAISEIRGVFKVSFELALSWFDPRLTFKNLKETTNLNKLTEVEKHQIWKPVIVFDNTESKKITQTDNRIIPTVTRWSNFTLSPKTNHEETYLYDGKDNPITFSRIYDIEFLCEYNMAWYPFDIQKCSMEFKPDGNTGEYIQLIKHQFRYLGKQELSVYFIRDSTFSEIPFDGINTVQGKVDLACRVNSY